MFIAVIPPNSDVIDEIIVVRGYKESHVKKFCNTYFKSWKRTENITQFKYRKDIYQEHFQLRYKL